jgi:hypothetical protein
MVSDALPPMGSQPTVRKALVLRRHHYPLRELVSAVQTQLPRSLPDHERSESLRGSLRDSALVVRYSIDFAECWRDCERDVGRSWRCDETYIKVGGQWMYLYRAVDEGGKTVESHLSRTRDMAAAKAFFRKALKRHGQPRTVTLDGFEPAHSALRRMGLDSGLRRER